MTPAERDYAIAYLERTKAALLDATAHFSHEQWRLKPAPEQWSPAECVEHLAITETSLLKAIQKTVTEAPAPADVLASCAGKEQIIEKAVPSRGRKVQAPEPARPTNRFADPLAEFIATRARTLEYVRTTSDPIRVRTYPHFVFGPLDGYQWLIFMAAHTERHLAQLLEVTREAARATGS